MSVLTVPEAEFKTTEIVDAPEGTEWLVKHYGWEVLGDEDVWELHLIDKATGISKDFCLVNKPGWGPTMEEFKGAALVILNP